MPGERDRLISHVVKVSEALPFDWLLALADRIERLNDRTELGTIQPLATTPESRELFDTLKRLWTDDSGVTPNALGLAVRTAAFSSKTHAAQQAVEIVWTGPGTEAIPVRRTDQALLQLIEHAKNDLIIVSFVAYRLPHIVHALNAATKRQVNVRVVLEPSDETGGKVSFDSLKLMNELVPDAALYYWPLDKRPTDSLGRYGSLHAKCAVADSELALVTSANLTEYAMEFNLELGLLVRGGEIANHICSHFNELIRRESLVSL